jgi:DNA-binding SARP family transcriptional activator
MPGETRQDPANQEAEREGEYELQLLGTFLLRRGGTKIALPLGPQRLLAFLAIQGPALRPVVMGALWQHVGEQHARGSLRTTMWRLRRDAPHLVQSAGDALALRADVSVDIRAATDSAQGILQRSGQIPADRAVLCARGDLLPGWYEEWVIFERERFRQLRLHALDTLATRFSAHGRYAEALEAAIESARIEPLRESANRMIIAIHLAEGNAAEALRHYRFFRGLLAAELRIEPSPQLTAMLSVVTPGALAKA